MRTPRPPERTPRLLLLGALLGLLLSADAQSHGQEQLHRPEALLRKAWFSLSPGDWMRRQRLQAAREHRLPAGFSSCSSLQGPSCLTSAEPSVSLNWGPFEGAQGYRDSIWCGHPSCAASAYSYFRAGGMLRALFATKKRSQTTAL